MPSAVVLQFPSMAKSIDPALLPNRIRELRLEQDMILETLASAVGVSIPHMSSLELGKRELTMPVMERIARSLGVAVADLLRPAMGGLTPDERRLIETYRAGQAALSQVEDADRNDRRRA